MRLLLSRLLFALSLVVGADLVLFLCLDSGLLGDAALQEVGPRATATDVAYARLRLGHFRRLDAESLLVKFHTTNPELEAQLRVQNQELQLNVGSLQTIALPTEALTLQSFASAWNQLQGEDWEFEVFCPPDMAQRPASGLMTALQGLPLRILPQQRTSIPWAEAIPSWQRFGRGLLALCQFDFGTDRQGRPIATQLLSRGKRSLMLSLPAFFLSTFFAIALALWAAARRHRSRALQTLAVCVMSCSSLAWILLLREVFSIHLHWFPLRTWSAPYLPLLALPILIWVWLSTWPDFLLYLSMVKDRQRKTWMLAARARGLSPMKIWWRHMLPNLAAPISSLLCVTLPFLILGSLLLEFCFDIPGLGNALVNAVQQHDANLLRALTFFFALAYIVAQWLGDLLSAFFDPRLRSWQE